MLHFRLPIFDGDLDGTSRELEQITMVSAIATILHILGSEGKVGTENEPFAQSNGPTSQFQGHFSGFSQTLINDPIFLAIVLTN